MEPQLLHKIGELLEILERTTGEPGELTSTLRNIAESARNFFVANNCVIYAINPITGRFVESFTLTGDQVESKTLFDQPYPGEVTQRVLQQRMLLVKRLDDMLEYQSPFTQSEGIQAFVGLALYTKYNLKPLGVLYLGFKDSQRFSPDVRELLQLFVDQASYILQETWLVRRYREVARIGQEMNQELATVDVLFRKLQQHVSGILDISHVFLLAIYVSPINMLHIHMYQEGKNLVYNNLSPGGAIQHVIEAQDTFFSRHISAEEALLPFRYASVPETERGESVIFVPLVLRGVSLGVLSIQHSESNAYNEEDRFILELLGNHIALALYNMRLYDSLNRLNEAGQFLTQQIDSAQVLQETADKIWQATEADNVILYSYDPIQQHFVLPPSVAGTLLDLTLTPLHITLLRPYDIAVLALRYAKPIFAKQSASIYPILQGNVQGEQLNFQQREKIQSVAILPLIVGDVPVGILFLNFRQPQHFDTPQTSLIEGLAHYAAIAIKNAQTFGALSKRRLRELEILQNIDRELSQTLDLSAVLDTILRLGQEHVPAEEASILLHDPHTHILKTAAAIGRHAEASRAQIISLRETKAITRWVVEHKESVRVNNVRQELPWRNLHFPVAPDITSELDVPILDGEEVVGILNFESTRKGAFDEEAEVFLITLAGQAVLAIKKAQAYEREKRLAADGQALNQISKEITSQLEYTHIFDLILEKALELTSCTRGNLMLYDSKQNDLWMAAERGIAEDKRGQRQELNQGIVGYVAAHKQLLNVDLSQSPWHEINMDFFPGTLVELAVPMLAGDELRGVLNVESSIPNHFSEGDEHLLQGLADLAVIALQNAESYERERRLAEESQVLNSISKEITSQLDLNHVFDLILDKALELTHSNLCGLMLYDTNQHILWMAAERGVASDQKDLCLNLNQGFVGYVAKTKQLLNVKDITELPWNEIYLEISPDTRSELIVPMLAGNELHGVLNVESYFPHNFSERDERLLKGLADLAVVALQNARAFEREKRSATESQALNEISQKIAIEIDPVHIFQFILKKALELTGSTVGSLHLYDFELHDLAMAAEDGVANERKGQRQKMGEGIVGYAATHKRLCNAEDVSQPPWNEIYVEFSPGVCSELVVPMLEGNELRGVLNIENLEPGHFTEDDVRLVKGLADLAVVASQSTERYQKASREALHTEMLYQAGRELANISDWERLDQAYDIILRIAEEHSSCQVVIRRYDDITQELVSIRASNYQNVPPFQRINLSEGLNGQVARERRTRVIYDTQKPPFDVALKLSDTETRSLLITPIQTRDRYYGNLSLGHRESWYFRGSEISFFEGLADQLASTIYRLETVKTRQEFEKISSFGHSAFELTHRLANDLGLIEFYVDGIQRQMGKLEIDDQVVSENLNDITQSVKKVLSFNAKLKQELDKQDEEEPVLISPQELLKEAMRVPSLPSTIQVSMEPVNGVEAVRVIRNQIADILHNLVRNASDAMPDGGEVILQARNSGRFVALEVIDTGIGIPLQEQEKIFDLSYSQKGSSGFGLWSALRNARRNGGDLRVESRPGRTVFTLLLPRTDGGTV